MIYELQSEKKRENAFSRMTNFLDCFHSKDIIVDPLAMTISTDSQSANETLKMVKYLNDTLGVKTILGVSNISFGLPERETVNSAFFNMALSNGLSAGIINPLSDAMMNTYHAFLALRGLDENHAISWRSRSLRDESSREY